MTGNWGEQYVAERLAHADCLVRHVPQGRDAGIDLYCESVVDEKPFLHFWVQIKTGDSYISKIQDRGFPTSVFTPDEMEYWSKQVVPVLIAVVTGPNVNPRIVHIYCPLFGSDTHLLSIRRIENEDDWKAFVHDDLPHLMYLWGVKDGVLRPLPVSKAGYVRTLPVSQTYVYEDAIKQTLHLSLWGLSYDILSRNIDLETLQPRDDAELKGVALADKVRPYIKTLETLVELANIGNYQNHVTIGVLYELEGRFAEAKDRYQKALASVKGDSQFMAAAGTDTIVKKLESYLARVGRKLPNGRHASS
jgi:hypothetical protein